MGRDFEIVAYRGNPVPLADLVALLQHFTPYADLFRHSLALELKAPLAPDLHCIAFYEQMSGWHEDDDNDNKDHKAYYSESMLVEAKHSLSSDPSLAALQGRVVECPIGAGVHRRCRGYRQFRDWRPFYSRHASSSGGL